jgi:hypothetical protein
MFRHPIYGGQCLPCGRRIREEEEFGKGGFDDIEEFFAGDTVELV